MNKTDSEKHEKPDFDILGRIESERKKRGWTQYLLAKNSGIPQSTLATWYKKNMQPSVASIEKICSGLGITLSQFFSDEDDPLDHGISSSQKILFEYWACLTHSQQDSVEQVMLEFRKLNW